MSSTSSSGAPAVSSLGGTCSGGGEGVILSCLSRVEKRLFRLAVQLPRDQGGQPKSRGDGETGEQRERRKGVRQAAGTQVDAVGAG